MPAHSQEPDAHAPHVPQRPTATLIGIFRATLQHWRYFVAFPILIAVVVLGITFLRARTYSSSFSFVPQVTDDAMSGASGIAAQLGINLSGVDLTQTPDFYAGLMRSKQIMRSLVDTKYHVTSETGDTSSATLVTIYEAKGETPEIAREEAILELESNLRVATDLKTGVIRVATRARQPGLAHQMADRALEVLNTFNTESRQTRAVQEGRFISGRLVESKQELRHAEDVFQSFLEKNRGDLTNSPQLVFERDRLQREVVLRNELYAALAQRFDQARIEQARNTPAITLVERPILPARPDRRFLIYKGVTSLIAGFALAGLLVFVRLTLSRAAEEEPIASRELSNTWEEVVGEQPGFIRRILSR